MSSVTGSLFLHIETKKAFAECRTVRIAITSYDSPPRWHSGPQRRASLSGARKPAVGLCLVLLWTQRTGMQLGAEILVLGKFAAGG